MHQGRRVPLDPATTRGREGRANCLKCAANALGGREEPWYTRLVWTIT